MQDRELLELAAKAAGNLAGWCSSDAFGLYAMRLPNGASWNPLDDDGDALRLAVKLGMEIYSAEDSAPSVYAGVKTYCIEPIGDDAMAATRRAIVRAAAEIGRAMP